MQKSDGEQRIRRIISTYRNHNNEITDGPRESTMTDARTTNCKSKEERTDVSKKQIEVPAVIGREDEEYNMAHPRRGAALIFNYQKFERMAPRKGTEKDVVALIETFENLGFETRIYIDLTYEKFSSVLEDTAKEDHRDSDCLVVTVMSHGEPGYIHCYDTVYPADKLWESFTSDNCPSLANKPKLFFVQACRGRKSDVGVRMRLTTTQTDSVCAWYTLPTCADILVAYSTVQGYYAWIDPSHGSWFIQVLCEELGKHGRTRDLLGILTLVCRRVATDFQSHVPEDERMDLKKQVPAFTSMLTRQVFFR